jgi:hypothetical protein
MTADLRLVFDTNVVVSAMLLPLSAAISAASSSGPHPKRLSTARPAML